MSKYGISRLHPFSELSYFDITKCAPPDIIHDLAEGVITKTLNLILKVLVSTNEKAIEFNNKVKKNLLA